MNNGEEIFKSLWHMTHGDGFEAIPLKAITVKVLLEWMHDNMKKSLLTKLGISAITERSEKEVEGFIALDQVKRTRVRKANQVKYGKKKGKKA